MNHFMMQLNSLYQRGIACKAVSEAQEGTIVIIKDTTRSLDQNARFHALCGDAARTREFMGRRLTLAQWKVLFISGHAIATKQPADVVPGLEGEFVNLRESSAEMGVRRMSSLIEYTQAYLANE